MTLPKVMGLVLLTYLIIGLVACGIQAHSLGGPALKPIPEVTPQAWAILEGQK